MSEVEIIKIICLFLSIMFTVVNVHRAIMKNTIPASNFMLQCGGITGFIYLQWLIK